MSVAGERELAERLRFAHALLDETDALAVRAFHRFRGDPATH